MVQGPLREGQIVIERRQGTDRRHAPGAAGQPNEPLSAVAGEALHASFAVGALWQLLLAKGVAGTAESVEVLDQALLFLEKNRAAAPGDGPEAIDHARTRLESLIRLCSEAPRE